MANHSGTISATETWADGDVVTGSVTITGQVTVPAGATIYFSGDYIITTTTGVLIIDGVATSRVVFKSNQADPTDRDWSYIYYNNSSGVGNVVKYVDLINGDHTSGSLLFSMTGGTIATVEGVHVFDSGTGGIGVIGTHSVNMTIQNCKATDLRGDGLTISTSGTPTLTVQDLEIRRCVRGVDINTSATMTLRRLLILETTSVGIYEAGSSATSALTVIDCFVMPGGGAAAAYCIQIASTVATPTVAVTDSILGGSLKIGSIPIFQSAATGRGIISSGNDIGGSTNVTAGTGIYVADVDNASTSDNDYIFGCATASLENPDTSESTTSTEIPSQYRGLTVARTNARATPNFPATIDTIADGSLTDTGATITWNSNRPMNSEVYLSTSSGIDPNDPSTYELCYVADDDWSNLSGRGTYKDKSGGMIGTGHTAVLDGLRTATTYYYVVRGVDPVGTSATGTEGDFTTTGGATVPITIAPTINSVSISGTTASFNATAPADTASQTVTTFHMRYAPNRLDDSGNIASTSINVSGGQVWASSVTVTANTPYRFSFRVLDTDGFYSPDSLIDVEPAIATLASPTVGSIESDVDGTGFIFSVDVPPDSGTQNVATIHLTYVENSQDDSGNIASVSTSIAGGATWASSVSDVLSVGVSYRFQVYAIDDTGFHSPRSDVEVLTTESGAAAGSAIGGLLNPRQIVRQIAWLLENRKWAGSDSNSIVFGKIAISSETDYGSYLSDLILPSAFVEAPDHDSHPELETYYPSVTTTITLFTSVENDRFGQSDIIGGSRPDLTDSGGRGMSELIIEAKDALIDGGFEVLSQRGARPMKIGELRAVTRQLTITSRGQQDAFFESPRYLLAVQGSYGANNVRVSWTLPPNRFDREIIVLRYKTGTSAPTSITDGTGVGLSADLATTVDQNLAAETYSWAVFCGYDDNDDGTAETYSLAGEFTLVVT